MAKSKNIAQISNLCVACGTCIKQCPFGAIQINNGIRAVIDLKKCVGCGQCSKICPASVIEMTTREVLDER